MQKLSATEEQAESLPNQKDSVSDTPNQSSVINSDQQQGDPRVQVKQNDVKIFPDTNRFKQLATKYRHLYIDKTSFIKQVLQKHDKEPILLITRPSGWGKTVNLTMLKNFLQAKVDQQGFQIVPNPNQALFQGGIMMVEEDRNNANQFPYLQQYEKLMENRGINQNLMIIESIKNNKPDKNIKKSLRQYTLNHLKICKFKRDKLVLENRSDFGAHPVIFVDFSKVTKDTIDGIKYQFFAIIHQLYIKHSYLQKTNQHASYNLQLQYIEQIIRAPQKIRLASVERLFINFKKILEDHFKKQCYILVDNYDEPVLKLLKSNNIIEIRQIAALIVSLFINFGNSIDVHSPISGEPITNKANHTRVIVMGKTNIFSTYLGHYIHRGIGDPSFYPQFGINQQELHSIFIPQILDTLNLKMVNSLQFKTQLPNIAKQMFSTIKNWYGGYTQQLCKRDNTHKDKYGFGSIWNYMKQYIFSKVNPKEMILTINGHHSLTNSDEIWLFQRIIQSMNLSKLIEFHLNNPPYMKLLVSEFLCPDYRSLNYLRDTQIIHLAYSMGYLTGIFLPICASQTYIVQPRFPNLDIQTKFKSSILSYLQSIFNAHSLKLKELKQYQFSLIDSEKFKVSIESLINTLMKQKLLKVGDMSDECCHVYYMAIILYQILSQRNCGYIPASYIDNHSVIIDNIYVSNTLPLNQEANDKDTKHKDPAILIDIRYCQTVKSTEINSLCLAALRDIYEDTEKIQRLLNMKKQISVEQVLVKVRVGVIGYNSRKLHHKMFLLHDIQHNYLHLENLLNFFTGVKTRSKWMKAQKYLCQIQGYTMDFSRYFNDIEMIANGRWHEIDEKMKNIVRKNKKKGIGKHNEGDSDDSDSNSNKERMIKLEKKEKRRKRQNNLEAIYFQPESSDEENRLTSRIKPLNRQRVNKDQWKQAYLSVKTQMKQKGACMNLQRRFIPEQKIENQPKNIQKTSFHQSKPNIADTSNDKQKIQDLSQSLDPTNLNLNSYLSQSGYNYALSSNMNPSVSLYLSENDYSSRISPQKRKEKRVQSKDRLSHNYSMGAPTKKFRHI